jgi:hypothetical protein
VVQSGQVAMIMVRVSFPTVSSWSVKGPIPGILHRSGLFCFACLTFPSFPGVFLRSQYLSLVTSSYDVYSRFQYGGFLFQDVQQQQCLLFMASHLGLCGIFLLLLFGERLSMFGHCEALTGYVSRRTC